jgi:hypothetical protein
MSRIAHAPGESPGSVHAKRPRGDPFEDPPSKWWTRSERIRTASEIALSFSLIEFDRPVYQQIAHDVERLHALGLSLNKIALWPSGASPGLPGAAGFRNLS